jgi:hypothetical protein
MDELEQLRSLVGPAASEWTNAQLEQLSREMNAMAALLLDLYHARKQKQSVEPCGSPGFDVRQPDR